MAHTRFPHSAVLHVYAGEDERGKATYEDYALTSVYVEALRATHASGAVLAPEDRIRLYFFTYGSHASGASGLSCVYRSPREWDELTGDDRQRFYTFHPARDRLAIESETYTVTDAQGYLNGSPRTRHWEVTAK